MSAWCGGLLVLDEIDCAFDQARFLSFIGMLVLKSC